MNQEETEGFCGACVAGGIALVGASSAVGSTHTQHYKKKRKTMFWCGIITVLLSILFIVYVYYGSEKSCKQCSSSSSISM